MKRQTAKIKMNLNFPEKDLEKILPTLLSLHGVNKALDIFLNIEYDLAYEALADFRNTHEAILRGKHIYNSLLWEFKLIQSSTY